MKSSEVRDAIGRPVQVVYTDPTFRSERTLVTGVLLGMDEETDRPLAIVQLSNGRALRVDPDYLVDVKPPRQSK